MTRGWCCQQEMELKGLAAVSRHPSLTIFLVCLFISSQHLHSPPLLVKSAEGRSLSPARLLYGGCQGHTGRRWRFSFWWLHNRCDNCRAPGKSSWWLVGARSMQPWGSWTFSSSLAVEARQAVFWCRPSVVAPTQGQLQPRVCPRVWPRVSLWGLLWVGRAPHHVWRLVDLSRSVGEMGNAGL